MRATYANTWKKNLPASNLDEKAPARSRPCPNGELGKSKRALHDSAQGGHGPSSSPENFLRGPQENRQWDLRQRIKHPYPPWCRSLLRERNGPMRMDTNVVIKHRMRLLP